VVLAQHLIFLPSPCVSEEARVEGVHPACLAVRHGRAPANSAQILRAI
jgi:hypothetical protein